MGAHVPVHVFCSLEYEVCVPACLTDGCTCVSVLLHVHFGAPSLVLVGRGVFNSWGFAIKAE